MIKAIVVDSNIKISWKERKYILLLIYHRIVIQYQPVTDDNDNLLQALNHLDGLSFPNSYNKLGFNSQQPNEPPESVLSLSQRTGDHELLQRQYSPKNIGNCLMPLCPTCIREHTQYHQDMKTKPIYFSIQEVTTEVKQLIFAAIKQLEQDNLKRTDLSKRIDSWNNYISQSMMKAKQLVLGWVQEEFKEIQAGIIKHFARKHQQLGVYSVSKTEKMQNQISKTIQELYTLFDSMKTDKFLGSIIVYLEDSQNKVQSLHSKFSSFHQANDRYSPRLEMNKGFKSQFTSCLSKIFRYQSAIQKESSIDDRQKSPRFMGRNNIKRSGVEEKYEKLQRSYTPQRSLVYLRNGSDSGRLGHANINQGNSQVTNLGHSNNRVYKQQSPQRIYNYSPSTNDVLSPTPLGFGNQPRRSIYRNER